MRVTGSRPGLPGVRPPLRAARLPVFYGWVLVATAFVTMAITVNARTAFSLFFPAILDEFGWSRGLTAATFTTGLLASNAFTPFLGVAMERLGPRILFPLSLVLVSAGFALATAVRAPWQLHLTLGVLVAGASVPVSYMGHALLLPGWFVRQRGLAMGVAFSGVGVGSFLLLPWLQGLIGAAGWRQACWTLAVLVAVLLVPLNALLPRRRPEELGLRPDGDPAPAAERRAREDAIVDRAWAATDWTLARAARTARFWWVFVGYFTGLFAWYAVQVHQTKYLLELGFSPELAAYALGLVGFTGIAGQIAWGHVSDRVGREWAWTASGAGYVLCYAVLLALPAHPTPALVYVMVAAQGLLGYGLASVFGAIPVELFQGARYGSIFAVLNLASNAGAGLGPWVAGAVHDRTGSYAPAFWLAIACAAASVAAMWLAAPRKVRRVAGRAPRRAPVPAPARGNGSPR
jgi:MFS family permease